MYRDLKNKRNFGTLRRLTINTSLRVEEQDLEFTLACFSRRDKVDYRPVKRSEKRDNLENQLYQAGVLKAATRGSWT